MTATGARRFVLRVPSLETSAAWLLALIWIFPLLYAFWAAFHPAAYMVRFDLFAPLTLENFANAWAQAPFARYYLNTFLLRQTFKTIPRELEDAARIEGCGWMAILLKVYVPLAKPTYLAYGLVSVSHHWNNFLWPLVVTNSVESRPLTVGLGIFSAPETGVNWATVSAATLLSIAPLLVAFLLFQRQFVQSFLRAGIR